eukprot:gene10704-11882_t
MEFCDGDIEDFSNDLAYHLDEDADFVELCGLFIDGSEENLSNLLQKRSFHMSSSPSSFEHYSSSSRSLEDISEQKKRKKEITAMNASKIPMDDIRRRYPSIMKDVLNSCDPEKCRALVKNHCVGTLSAMYRYVGNNKTTVATSDHVEIKGCQALCKYWESLCYSIPDGLMDIVETKFRLLPNKQSSIVCKFLYSGTKILRKSTDGISAVLFSAARESSGAQQRGDIDDGQSLVYYAPLDRDCPDKIDYENKRPFTFDEDLPHPQKVAIIGTLTLFTDSSHKVFRMEFIFSLKT